MNLRLFVTAVAAAVLLPGCREPAAPGRDQLRGQLLRDACDALTRRDTAAALAALDRLALAAPDDPFPEIARTWLQRRQTLGDIQAALEAGDAGGAGSILAATTGEAFQAASGLQAALAALAAVEEYLGQPPFPSAATAREALERLRAHEPVLGDSDTFRAFLSQEEGRAAALQAREASAVLRALVGELDLAAVGTAHGADLRLAVLAAIAPNHALPVAWRAALTGGAGALAAMAQAGVNDPAAAEALEIAACLAWEDGMAKTPAQPWLDPRGPGPASLSGLFLRVLSGSAAGDRAAAVQDLRDLAAVTPLREDYLEHLLSLHLLTPQQVQAWCWRSPVPGVPELLSRLLQMRSRPAN